jgi:hypothetical protein
MNLVLGQQFIFGLSWLGALTLEAGGLRLSGERNSNLGFALAFRSVPPHRGFLASRPLTITSLSHQAESGRTFTMTTPVDVNGVGDAIDDRAVVQTSLDQFRGVPYIQTDLRITRPFNFHERWHVSPFIEMFNVFNRNNPGANFVTNLAALPTPVNNLANATAFCLNADCTQTQPITSLNQLPSACRGAGGLLWSRYDGWHSVRGPDRNPAKFLKQRRS